MYNGKGGNIRELKNMTWNDKGNGIVVNCCKTIESAYHIGGS